MINNPIIQDTLYLASCAANLVIPDRERIENMNIDHIYILAKSHMITVLVASALERAEVKEDHFRKAKAEYSGHFSSTCPELGNHYSG